MLKPTFCVLGNDLAPLGIGRRLMQKELVAEMERAQAAIRGN